MNEYLSSITGNPLYGILLAVIFLFSCRGTGTFLLSRFHLSAKGTVLPACIGFNTAAFVLCLLSYAKIPAVSLTFFLLFLTTGFFADFKYRDFGTWRIFPLFLTLFTLGNALSAPSGWDECVYQLTVPFRWASQGNWNVFADLPYSGFPLLPQYIYREIIVCSGVCAAKATAILSLCLCGWFLCEEFPLKRDRFAMSVGCLALFFAPIIFVLACGTYSEAYIALNFVCAIKLIREGKPTAAALFCGFFTAGPAAAVKLNGAFIGIAVLAYAVIYWTLHNVQREKIFKGILVMGLAAALFVLPFYLRPFLQTGNPFWPYLGWIFSTDPAIIEMSMFHHAIGNAGFGTDSIWGILLAPLLLTLPNFDEMFDGSYGLQYLPILLIGLWYLFKKRKRFRTLLPGLSAGCILYFFWYFTAPQSRFLLPAVLLLTWNSIRLVQLNSGVRQKTVLLLITGLALYSGLNEVFWRNTIIRFRRFRDPVNLLYSESGNDFLPACDILRQNKGKKMLLLFEERTLYMPETASIATPFFQSARFTPPDNITPESILDEMTKANAELLYFRIPRWNPDLSKPHLERCQKFFDALKKLEGRGDLVRRELSDIGILYSRSGK